MTTYIIRRLIQSVIVLLMVSIIVFLAMRLLPGDPILMMITQEDLEEITQEEIDKLRHEHGLDRSLPVQYADWLLGVFRGDLGDSIVHQYPVTDELGRRIPITMHLGLMAYIISLIIGIPAGIICAVRRGTWLDNVVTVFANIGITIPIFWLGVVLVYIFSLKIGLLPVQGYVSPFDDFWLNTRQIIMPVFCMGIFPVASIARQTRSSMLEVMNQDYIRTAWSKGLRERFVIMRHALKNALIPVVTLAGLGASYIIGGSVLIETVFAIPGMGLMAVTSVFSKDYPITQGITLLIAGMVVLVNLAVDISYGYLDPRIRYR
jgi:peptide/nickel transport system permease protein